MPRFFNTPPHELASYSLIGALFFIPLSPSLKSVFIVLSVLCLLLTPSARRAFSLMTSQPWCHAAIAFFLLSVVACLWSLAPAVTQLTFLGKYSKLLCLPLFAIGFRSRQGRLWGLYAFVGAMTITCVLSLISNSPDPGAVFHNHIVTGFMMAFAAYLAGLWAISRAGLQRVGWGLLAFLFSIQLLWVNTGRSGYVLHAVLTLLLLIQTLPKKYWAMGVILLGAWFGGAYYHGATFFSRSQAIVHDVTAYQHGETASSLGFRWQFYRYAKTLFLTSPLKGLGTGSFSAAFQRDNPVPAWINEDPLHHQHLLDPHSQYWLIAVELGLIGLGALAWLYSTLALAAFQLTEMRPVMLGMLVAFILGSITDALLLYSAVGYLFVVICALSLGEAIEQRQRLQAEVLEPTVCVYA